ncbi:MAG: hypothetical protein HY040_25115 [Planctomycetes bacterium]|nr:hypothetical protein [Planctomycetota bacterium]
MEPPATGSAIQTALSASFAASRSRSPLERSHTFHAASSLIINLREVKNRNAAYKTGTVQQVFKIERGSLAFLVRRRGRRGQGRPWL